MIATSDPPLLLVTAPCTGGRWMSKVLRRLSGAKSLAAPCAPAWLIDEEEELAALRRPDLLRVGLVRDPWSWYAEAWMTGLRLGGPSLAAVRAWGGGSTLFRDFLYGATHPETRKGEVPAPLGVVWEPSEGGVYPALLASTLGLCAFTFLYHYGTKAAWQAPTERPGFAVDALADGDDLEGVARALLGAAAEPLPPLPGPPAAVLERVRIGFDSEMARWVAEADRPVLTAMRYAPFVRAGVGPLFPVRHPGATRREPVTPLPTSRVERLDRSLVEQLRAARSRGPSNEAPVAGTAPARLRRWIETPG